MSSQAILVFLTSCLSLIDELSVYSQPVFLPVHAQRAIVMHPVNGEVKVKDFLKSVSSALETEMTYENRGTVMALIADKYNQCVTTDDVSGCEAGVYFAGGYRFQVEAENDADHEAEYLAIARHYYLDALQKNPDYQSAYKNLVLLQTAVGNVFSKRWLKSFRKSGVRI